ncbi:hypothetical protein FRB90_005829 [Tulasnella sp. 427]|nr:hypothetical protein FRB90_005829 [Tulasnella sp. 427]
MSFVMTHLDGRPEYKLPRLQKLVTFLESQPQTLTWTKTLYFGRLTPNSCHHWNEDNRKKRDEEYSALEPRLLVILLQMTNLSYLWLSFVSLDLSIVSFIARSRSLETLEISAPVQPDSSNAASISFLRESGAEKSTLRTFRWSSHCTGQEEALAVILYSSQNLTELCCWSPELASIISTRLPDQVFHNLRTLDLVISPQDSAIDSFLHLGLKYPSLITLKLSTDGLERPIQLLRRLEARGINSRDFPSIEIVGGPLPLVVVLTRGRRVREIRAYCAEYGLPSYRTVDQLALIESHADITSLYLGVSRWDEGDIEAVGRLFPHLENLEYIASNDDMNFLFVGMAREQVHVASTVKVSENAQSINLQQ